MSARDELLWFLEQEGDTDDLRKTYVELVENHRAEILHEAAEEIRKEMGPVDMVPGETEWVSRYVQGWHGAANYIDREVSK